jgi:hypothetical protein
VYWNDLPEIANKMCCSPTVDGNELVLSKWALELGSGVLMEAIKLRIVSV